LFLRYLKRIPNYFREHPKKLVTLVTAALSLFFSLLTMLWRGAIIIAALIAVTGYIVRGFVKKTLTEKLMTKITYPREVSSSKYSRIKRISAKLGRAPEIYKLYVNGRVISIRLGYCKIHGIYFECPLPLQCPRCLEEGRIWDRTFKKLTVTPP